MSKKVNGQSSSFSYFGTDIPSSQYRSKKQNKEGNEDMKLSYTKLVKRPALLHRLTGLTVKEFETLLESFSAQYDQLVIQPRVSAPGRQRAVGGGQKGALPDAADKLLFILV